MVHGFYICIIINFVLARLKNSYFSTQFCSSANLHNTLVEKLETLYFSESQFKYFRSEYVRVETKPHIIDYGIRFIAHTKTNW